jgi:hypothetical protein
MCDDAENLAGAGTDVRRCSDALGPRKNLPPQALRPDVHYSLLPLFRASTYRHLLISRSLLVDLHNIVHLLDAPLRNSG